MNMKKTTTLFSLAVVFVMAAASLAQANTVYNMQQAVDQALEANPTMLAARHDMLGAEAGRKSARGSFLPSASVSYGYTRYDHDQPTRDNPTRDQDVWSASFNVHQDLFTGWRILSTYQRAQLSEENATARVLNTELSLVNTVQENFLGLLKAREDVRSAKDSVTRLREQLKVTQAFYDVGLQPRLDVLQAEVDLAGAEDALLTAENSVATQIVRLNTLLGLAHDADVDYEGNLAYQPFTLTIEDALERAYKDRPDLIIAKRSVEIAVKDKSITDSAFYPQVGADFDWSTYGDDPNASGDGYANTEYSEWTVGVRASWTFWQWGKTYYASEQAKQNVSSLLQSADNTRNEATYSVKSYHLAIGNAKESIRVNKKAVEAAQESYRMAVARYQAQVGTNTDVLDAQSRLTYAEAALTAALANYEIALSRLFVSIGEKNTALTSR
ncbi:MAG: TolC family protein [Proteobacteria bacterium]|nr:TolC family protein [Pseudomonadota bacterium]